MIEKCKRAGLRRSRGLFAAAAAVVAGGTGMANAGTIGDVFVIAMENHNWTQPASQTSPGQIFGNPAAPFINSLVTPGNPNAAQVSYATNYQNAAVGDHPSEPNYIWAEAASNLGVVGTDQDPYATSTAYPNGTVQNTTNHLTGLLQAKGITWKSYQEDTNLVPSSGTVNQPGANSLTSTVAPQSQWTVPLTSFSGTSPSYVNPYNGSNQYNYAAKHNPQIFFTDTNGGNNQTASNPLSKNYAPLQQLQTDLNNNSVARYNWITPNQYNDMHSTLTNGFTYNGTTYTGDQANIAQGDNFLAKIIPQIEASQAYKNNGAIVIWNDETEGGDDPTRTSMEIVISPLSKGNASSSATMYTHSSDVKTMQEIFQVGPYINEAGSPTINDLSALFQPGTIPSSVPVPEPASLGLLATATIGLLRRRR